MSYKVLTAENFDETIAKGTVMVDFWAAWCGPCRMIAPTVEEIAEEYAGKVVVGKVNVDEQSMLAAKYNIASIPTILVFKDGQLAHRSVGVRPKSDLVALL
ncbi:MAG: thioredoxin [Oscillospiraceae bacterium]|nr:thioredoxin [Oscillospiraceae bacterium]